MSFSHLFDVQISVASVKSETVSPTSVINFLTFAGTPGFSIMSVVTDEVIFTEIIDGSLFQFSLDNLP